MDQILPLAIIVVIVVLVIVGAVRVLGRDRSKSGAFGAGGATLVPVGTRGTVKTALSPAGVVSAVGEDWSARTRDGSSLAVGTWVHVLGQDGLVLLVEPDTAAGDPPSSGTTPT
jgi:membrane protein implicated in regulation of membrane protease activity